VARRYIDQKLSDLPTADGFKVLADRVNMPAMPIRRFGLKN